MFNAFSKDRALMKKMSQLIVQGSVMIISLVLVSGCDLFKKKEEAPASQKPVVPASADNGIALCSIDGDVVITEGEFLSNLSQMVQSNPYFRGASVDALPKELLHKFFDQLTTQALIEKYSIKNNIEQDEEYVKAYNETEKLLKRSLMVQIFEKKIYDNIKVSDSEISKHYSENKDRFVKSAGGVLAVGARFDSEESANTFLDVIKDKLDDFEKLAKEEKAAKFKDFGRVSKDSKGFQYESVPGPIKDSVLAMRKLPGVEKVKAGKEFWVVKAWDKKDTVIFALDEVRSHIESMLKNNLFRDALEKRVKELKTGFNIVINEDYFKETNPAGTADDAGVAASDDEIDAATAA